MSSDITNTSHEATITIMAPTRFALRIVGKNEDGRDCEIGIDWQGKVHVLAGPIMVAAGALNAGERVIYNGRVYRRVDLCMLASNPPQVRLHDDETLKDSITVKANTLVERIR